MEQTLLNRLQISSMESWNGKWSASLEHDSMAERRSDSTKSIGRGIQLPMTLGSPPPISMPQN